MFPLVASYQESDLHPDSEHVQVEAEDVHGCDGFAPDSQHVQVEAEDGRYVCGLYDDRFAL